MLFLLLTRIVRRSLLTRAMQGRRELPESIGFLRESMLECISNSQLTLHLEFRFRSRKEVQLKQSFQDVYLKIAMCQCK